jgi:hypothetical protein
MPSYPPSAAAPGRASTERFAERNHVKPATVIKRRCLTGSYHGVLALKLASGRLDWPDVVVLKHPKASTCGNASSQAVNGVQE